MRRFVAPLLIAGTCGVMLCISTAPSVAGTTSARGSGSHSLRVSPSGDSSGDSTYVLGDTGQTVSLPTDWSDSSVAALEAAGIGPGESFDAGVSPGVAGSKSVRPGDAPADGNSTPTATVEEAHSGVTPDSASGCNQSVCIWVYGRGYTVTKWDTVVGDHPYVCSFAAYLGPPNTIEATSNEVCGSGQLYSIWPGTHTFTQKTEICNTWANVSGKPCETVHN